MKFDKGVSCGGLGGVAGGPKVPMGAVVVRLPERLLELHRRKSQQMVMKGCRGIKTCT